ncbi:class I SAM-dependent methyltransferase [Nitrosovibrio tenuis]|uniref:Methyltransferase domain-containing protein n=1 Tax=Nitrosovibrio tenuis TaxID=1233 RepID=A0A1H7FX47_9PROT|nr:class I SAM-dependent methyltransferase [Nitrosovibrio tenuis]SEK30663.1 Conserved hypothetical protein 95 [Nitrosovibrio tenuis]
MKRDILLFSRVIRAWRRRSVSDFVRLVTYNLGLIATGKYWKSSHPFDQSFDRRFNVETAGTEEPEFLTAEEDLKAHAKGYEPVTEGQMRTLFGMLPGLDLSNFLFLDLGSGKGRALFVAASYPFKEIIGVEYSHELHEMAVRNVHTYRNPAQKCFNIKPVRADATTFCLPEYPTVCFINNPYDESMIVRTIENIEQSARSAPRFFLIIYIHAYYPGPIDAMHGWSRICEGSLGRSSYVIWQWDSGISL